MSALPSPLKSPTPTTCQFRSETVGREGLLRIVPPFISQISFCPLPRLRHSKSPFPSPLKSPHPTTCQSRSETVGREGLLRIVPPFISHSSFCPVRRSRHTTSLLPSPFRSQETAAWAAPENNTATTITHQ